KRNFKPAVEVRPDDIDMNQHVHASRYLDYVLAARYDQMARCYGMSMEEFMKLGYAWFQRSAQIEFQRPLQLGERFVVTTWVTEIRRDTVRVQFEIRRRSNDKMCSAGSCEYTMV